MDCNSRKNTQSKKAVLLNVLSEYFNKTSIHGIGYLGDNITKPEKIWWTTMLLVSIFTCSVQIVNIWEKWNNNPVIISISGDQLPVWNVPFPAVTICPFNIIERKIYQYREKYKNRNNLTEQEASIFWDISLLCNNPKLINNRSTNEDVLDKIRSVTSDSEFVISQVSFNGKYDGSFYNHITADGVCYTFNSFSQDDLYTDQLNKNIIFMENNKRNNNWNIEDGYSEDTNISTFFPRRTNDGVKSGLAITLLAWTISRDYACGEPVSGYKITLHNPAEYPQVGQQYVLAPLQHSVIISVKPKVMTATKSLKNLSIKARNCYTSNEKSLKFFKPYTEVNCRLECMVNVTQQYCGCVAFYMPRKNGTKICNNVHCIKFVKTELIPEFDAIQNVNTDENYKYISIYKTYQECDCLSSCASLSYDYKASYSAYDWKAKFVNQRFQLRAQVPLQWYQYTYVNIFFNEPFYTTFERSELYGQSDFLANCGGLLGLFLGFSFLSLIELIYYITVRLLYKLMYNNVIHVDTKLQ